MKNSIELYGEIGRKSGEYKLSLENGTLNEELSEFLDSEEIETAREFLEENGHIIKMKPKK